MPFHQVLQTPHLKELGLILHQIANDVDVTLDLAMDLLCVFLHTEGITCPRHPEVLLVIVKLTDDTYLV